VCVRASLSCAGPVLRCGGRGATNPSRLVRRTCARTSAVRTTTQGTRGSVRGGGMGRRRSREHARAVVWSAAVATADWTGREHTPRENRGNDGGPAHTHARAERGHR
jgi:hypothetical protein